MRYCICTSCEKRVDETGCDLDVILAQPSGGFYEKEQARLIKMIRSYFLRSSRKVDNYKYQIFVKLGKKKCSRDHVGGEHLDGARL